jgi:hypothetical protein
MFKNCRLARMSDGHYCFVRDLGRVKGGKGMKHHEVIIDFNRRGMVALFGRLLASVREVRPSQKLKVRVGVRELSQAHRADRPLLLTSADS